MAGKGSSPRPLSVDRNTFDLNWDLVFGNKGNHWDHYSDLPNPDAYDIPTLENEETWAQRVIDEKK